MLQRKLVNARMLNTNGLLRIALVIPHLGGGGAERSVLKLARGLVARGHAVDLLVFGKPETLADEVPAGTRRFTLQRELTNGIRDRLHIVSRFGLRVLPSLRGDLLADARSVAAYVNKEMPDCILPSLPRAKAAALLALSFTDFNPVVIPIVRNVLMSRRRRFRRLYSHLFPSADHLVAVSDGVADDLALTLKLPRENISRVYNPVVTPEIAEMARAIPDHPWMSDEGPPIVLSVGRLARVKDFPTLLRAFRQVSQSRRARLIILGEGSWRRRLENMVRKLGIETIVSMPGWNANPYAFMNRASVLVLSSKREGLGNVLIEAMACGCPCVSTNCPSGPSEILDKGRYGQLVPVGNAPALAAAIEHVLNSPPNRSTLLARARQFSINTAIDHYERIVVEKVLECRYGQRHPTRDARLSAINGN